MLTAQEAHSQAQKNIDECITTELCDVMKCIEEAVKEGKFSISEDGHLRAETIHRLETLGYTYKAGSQYNESYYYVSWKE